MKRRLGARIDSLDGLTPLAFPVDRNRPGRAADSLAFRPTGAAIRPPRASPVMARPNEPDAQRGVSEQTEGMADPPGPDRQLFEAVHGGLDSRVSDADRDQTVTLLREHVIVGRLTLDEFSDRVGRALEARTRGDLESTLTHLPDLATPPEEPGRRRPRRWFIAVMSGSQPKGRWRISGRTTAVAVMGGCEMDLRHAEIDGPEVVITAIAFWGGIGVTVPEGFDVELEGFSFMGGRHLRLRDVPLVPGSPRIRIRGFAIMGGIHVRTRPTRTERAIGQSIGQPEVGSLSGAWPGLQGWSGAPMDLRALGQDIKEQIRAQHEAFYLISPKTRDSGMPQAEVPLPSDPPTAGGEGTITILFSDMVDYAGMTERLGDQLSREVLHAHHRLVRQSLQTHGGREIKVQGDGFMVAFGGVARALRCAVEMQRAFLAYSETHDDRPIRVHIGVHTGEAMQEDDDFLGHTVIVASRIASAAGPGEVLVSALSAQLVERTGEFRFVDHRATDLKGLTRPQPVATLVWAE
jgi:class 3 adenylate cyclase